ncbi:MAG: microcompartment protein [Anaerospora sp.]|nr:microcompartment protein [Anaerospora sp.]
MYNAIGMIELTSIARGIYATDLMIKTAYVEVVSATPVCPGKYIAIIRGDVAAVESSVAVGVETAAEYLVDSFILPNVHPAVFPAITATTMPDGMGALGIMESFSLASMIIAADATAGIEAGKATVLEKGLLVDIEVIPAPAEKLWTALF